MSTQERLTRYQQQFNESELKIMRMAEQLEAEQVRKTMLSGAIQALQEELQAEEAEKQNGESVAESVPNVVQ